MITFHRVDLALLVSLLSLITLHTGARAEAPDAPTGLTGPGISSTGSYTIQWTATTNTTYYELREKQGESGAWVTHNTATATSKAFSNKQNGYWQYNPLEVEKNII